jgi:hypothetical protein
MKNDLPSRLSGLKIKTHNNPMLRQISRMSWIVIMQKQGYDTKEMEIQYDEYTDKVTKRIDSNFTRP